MATTTLVITYTAGTNDTPDTVTSMTVDGTAFGSLTAAQIADTFARLERAERLLLRDKVAATPGGCRGQGSRG